MANFTIKLHRYTPTVFDPWGFELEYPEIEGTEDNLQTLPKSNILSIQVKYIGTNVDPSKRYGINMMGNNYYYLNLFGAGILDLAGYSENTPNYRIGTLATDEFFVRVNAQVGGEVNRTAQLVRVSTLDQARVFTGIEVSSDLFQEMIRRMGGKYPPPPESEG